HAYALRVLLPRVRLDQHREAVALREVAGREARRGNREQKPGTRVVRLGQGRVERRREGAGRAQLRDQGVAQLAPAGEEPRVALIDGLGLQRYVGLEVRPVGNVQVRAYQRVVRSEQPQEGSHFWRVRLGVIVV